MTRRHRRLIARPIARLLLAAGAPCVALTAGCQSSSNPFTTVVSDYGERVDLDRLRNINPIDPAGFRHDDQSMPATAQAYLDRFRGVERAELSVEEARAAALVNNLDLSVSLLDPTIAAQSVDEQEAAWESTFNLSASYNKSDSPTGSRLDSAQQDFARVEPSLDIPLRTGGSISVGLPMTRSETNNEFSTLNPAYTSDLELSLTHQLLRGAGRRTNTHALRIASYNSQIAGASTRLQVIQQLSQVDRQYWQVYGQRQALTVREEEYRVAQAQLDRARRQFNAGAVAQIEVTRAESGLADRIDGIIRAQTNLLTAQRELKRVINIPGLDVDSATEMIPTSLPEPARYEFDRPTLAAAAVDQRMEMLELELRLLADASQIEFARNQTLPLVTLQAIYRLNGLGPDMNESISTTAENDFEDWSLGATASFPIGNEAAHARLRSAILQRVQRLNTRSARAQLIRQEVFDALDEVEAGWQRIMAARQSVILNQRSLEAEQRQFDVGGTTSTDVLDASAALALSRLTEIQAIVDYQIAQVNLAAATGTLIGAAKVRWEPTPYDPGMGEFVPESLRTTWAETDEAPTTDEPAATIETTEPSPPPTAPSQPATPP